MESDAFLAPFSLFAFRPDERNQSKLVQYGWSNNPAAAGWIYRRFIANIYRAGWAKRRRATNRCSARRGAFLSFIFLIANRERYTGPSKSKLYPIALPLPLSTSNSLTNTEHIVPTSNGLKRGMNRQCLLLMHLFLIIRQTSDSLR